MKKKRMSSIIFLYFMCFVTAILISVSSAYAVVTPLAAVDLRTAGDFVILSETGITNTGGHTSAITGNIGSSPITAAAMDNVFCSEMTGTIYGVDAAYTGSGAVTCFLGDGAYKTYVDNAIGDMQTAYTDAAGRTLPDYTELGAGDISGMTLGPGLYKWGTGVYIDNRGVTLSGGAGDIWIFQISQDLTVADTAIVTLSGGAQASNIFWQVGGGTGVSLGTTSVFNGNILAAKGIVLNTGATLNGRALAQTAVTLDANPVTIPEEATPVLTTILLSPSSANITVGDELQLNATGIDQYGDPIAANISYNTSNIWVAEVNDSGFVTAVSAGYAAIIAFSDEINSSSAMNVIAAGPVLTTIILSPESANLTVGDELQLNATSLDQYDDPIAAIITYDSSDPSIASVDPSGLVTAIAIGNTTMTATSGTVSATSLIRVKDGSLANDLNVTIYNPKEGIFNVLGIRLDLISNKNISVAYIDNAYQYPFWTTLCSRCTIVNKTINLRDGNHSITIKGTSLENETFNANIVLFVDSKKPQIFETYPLRNSFINGSNFYVRYSEINNPRAVLDFGLFKSEKECTAGLNQKCSFDDLDLSSYDGKQLNFTFTVYDIANNSARSVITKVNVDTSSPVINSMSATKVLMYTLLRVNVTEPNLYYAKYYDSDNSPAGFMPRWNQLCTRLVNGICEKKIYLKGGQHNLTVNLLDKAGNSVEDTISITV